MSRIFTVLILALCPVTSAVARVQDANSQPEPAPIASDEGSQQIPAISTLTVPAGTEIVMKIINPISSRSATKGYFFEIETVEPVIMDGQTIIAPGVKGMGEIIHAAPKGFGGRAGELILAARYLLIDDMKIGLKGLKLGRAGKDQAGTAVITTAVLPIAGVFVTGTSVDLPAGQIITAKLAKDFIVKNLTEEE